MLVKTEYVPVLFNNPDDLRHILPPGTLSYLDAGTVKLLDLDLLLFTCGFGPVIRFHNRNQHGEKGVEDDQ